MKKLKNGDEVIVCAGKEKGKKGKIKKIFWNNGIVVVEGLNKAKKTLKVSEKNPNGGFTEIEKGISISNVSLISPKKNIPTKVKIEVIDGKKVRISKKCGSIFN